MENENPRTVPAVKARYSRLNRLDARTDLLRELDSYLEGVRKADCSVRLLEVV